jgi:uncharacterized protein YdaU (DUF1376 family)
VDTPQHCKSVRQRTNCVNYYPFHLGDYAAHTAHLEPMEDLAYRRMLDLYYRTEKPLPRSIEEIARLIRLKGQEEAISTVVCEFFEDCSEGWMHARCDRELDSYRRMGEGGKRGAAKRWAKPADSQPIATPSEPQCQPEPEPEPKKEPTVLVGKASPSRPPDCPTEALIALYHEHLPMLPRVEVVNDSRKRALSSRWREVVTDADIRKSEDIKAAGLDWFAWFFGHVSKSRFLTGKSKDWKADFDFLMAPNKFAKVIEGSYHKEAA